MHLAIYHTPAILIVPGLAIASYRVLTKLLSSNFTFGACIESNFNL